MDMVRRSLPLLGILVLVLCLMGPLLVAGQGRVISMAGEDLAYQLYAWRSFGSDQIRHGNFPLWNPFVYSGTPYHGGFQAGLLYPLHLLFLLFPVTTGINSLTALQIFLVGAFMYWWAREEGLGVGAAFYCAVAVMSGAPHIFHLVPGHLPNLAAMVWAPLIFLCAGKAARRGGIPWILLGALAASIQVFAGHPQYVFYTWVALGIYMVLRLMTERGRNAAKPEAALGASALIGLGGLWLSSAQWLPGLEASRWGVRAHVSGYEFASMFSLPPENLLTFLSPFFMGNGILSPYWGRCYLWEMCAFFGTVSLCLAIVGLIWPPEGKGRRVLALGAAAGICVVLALGGHTPVFRLFYDHVPPFRMFRGSSKFLFPVLLFSGLLAGYGLQRLFELRALAHPWDGRSRRRWRMCLAGVTGLLVVCAAMIAADRWGGAVGWLADLVKESGESYLRPEFYRPEHIFEVTGVRDAYLAAWGKAAAILGCTLLLLLAVPKKRASLWILVAFGVAEVFLFARSLMVSFDPGTLRLGDGVLAFLEQDKGRYRVLFLEGSPNAGMLHGVEGIGGFDADIYAPYAKLLWKSQGVQPARNAIIIPIERYSPLFRLLGLRHIVGNARSIRSSLPAAFTEGDLAVIEVPGPLPKGYLVEETRVVPNEEEILASLERGDVDPAQAALMTDHPPASPVLTGTFSLPDDTRRPDWASDRGAVWFVREDTDTVHYVIRSEKEALLLTTEVAYPGWRAWIDGKEAPLLRANYIQRAIQVPAGTHLVTMRFEPGGWKIGMILSVTGVGAFIIVGGTCLGRQGWRRR